jgi:branched-chain amino acid transport system substrate-binding protein
VIDDRTAYGQGIADEFSAAAKAAGAKIVDQQYTNDQAVDFRSILTHTKALHADAIFYGGADTQAGAMIKQMHTLAMSMPLIGADMIHSDELIQIAGGAAEGTLASSGGSPLDKMPGGASYVARYTKRFNSPVELFSPYAYDGAMAVFAAMKKADSVDPHLYLADLKATRMQGVTSNDLGYDPDGDLRHGSVTVYKVKDGKWISAKTVVTK